MSFKRVLTAIFCVFIAGVGCKSTEDNLPLDTELYAGVPLDSLTSEDPPKTEKEAIERGDTALSQNKLDLALYEYIRSLTFKDGEHKDKSLFNIGRIHQSRNNIALAEKAYLKAVEANPDNFASSQQLGIIYAKAGRISESKAYLIKAIDADQARHENGEQVGRFELLTESVVNQLIVDISSPIDSYVGLGVLSDLEGRNDVAKRLYEKALQIDHRYVKALINLGYSHYMSGNYHIAKRVITTALQFEPGNEKALNNLALVHLALGENSLALNVFMRQMDAPEALNNVGYFLILQGKPDQAIPYLQQAIDKKPSYYKIANENLARALAEVRANKQKESKSSSEHQINIIFE